MAASISTSLNKRQKGVIVGGDCGGRETFLGTAQNEVSD